MNQIGLTCTPLPVNAEAHRFMPNGKYLRTGHQRQSMSMIQS